MVDRSKASANKHAFMLQTDSLDNPGEASTESASACRSVPRRLRVGFLAFLSLATAVLTAPLQVAATQPAPAGAIERTALAEHPAPSGTRANPVAVPGPPTNVRATEGGHNTINLAWRAPTDDGGAPITGYRIEWSVSGNSPWQTVGLSSPVRVWAHRGLDPGTTRYYRVRAVNSAGTGSASDVDSATTEPLPVVTISAVRRFRTEGAPAVFELTRDGNLTRSLSVDVAVAETGDMISGSAPVTVSFAADRSTVRLRVATDDDDADEPASVIRVIVRSGSTYTVGSNAIATVTVADNDDPAVAPGMPTNLRATQGGHNTINLAWRAPTDDGGAPVSGYRIEWSRSGNGQWRAIILTAPVQVWAHDGLDPGTTRYYRVSAINSTGTGAASDIDSAKTKALPVVTISAVPSSPTEGVSAVFELTREGNLPSSLSVDVAVTETGDMISGAAPSTVRFSAGQGTVKLQVPTDNDDADEPNSEITATVQSGSAYTVGSNATATVTVADNDDPVDVPGAPTNLRATEGGQNTINLAWRAPTDDGGAPISRYRVEWSPSGQWEAREAVVLTSPVTVWAHGGLDPGTTRYYRVSAINSAGTGAASDVDSATTEALPVVTISAVSRSLTEGDSALFQLTRDGDLTSALSVDVAVTETGDMISGSAPSTVSFSADQSTVRLEVPTDDDDADEPDSDITAAVQSGSVYTAGSNAAATVTVTDDDDPVDVPGVPTNLRATADGQAAINLAWEAPLDTGNAPITGYRIEVSSDRSSWEDLLANSGSAATTYAHGGLPPGATRYYRVSAINSAGTGAASDVDSAATEEAPLPVITISAVSRSLTEGDVALFQLTRDGDLTSSLSVDVAVTETGDMISGSAPSTVSFPADQSTATLTVATDNDDADEPDSDIRATVQSGSAYTVGSNAAATVTIADDDDPVDVPGVPTNLRATADGQAAINLAWEAPLDTGNAPITGYRIEVSSDRSSWEDLLANSGSAATTYAHGGLPPGATRYYRVSAINSAGTGAASDVDSAATEEAPLPVITISAVSRSLTEGDVALFQLTRDGDLTSSLSVDVAVTETGDMISGSAPSTVSFPADQSTATLTVATDNDDADEPDSDIRATVQSGSAYTVGSNAAATVTIADDDDPVDVPGVPTNLRATADGQTAINLAWEAPLDTGNAPITGYRIEVSSDRSSWEDLLANSGSAATTYAHGGLPPGATRYYRVSAINSAGTGAASDVDSAATEEAPLPVITISAVSRSLTEGDVALFQLTRDGDLTSSLSVDVAVTETGDMISGSAPSTVSFPADQSTATLTVATDNDDADEPDSDIRATVQSGSAYTVGSNAAATVTIADDDDPVDVPGVPTNLRATADGQTAINLAWEAPLDTGNAPITGYRIEVSSDRSSWEDLLANTGSAAKTYAHGGLPPGTTRHYRVFAINSAGIGAASNVASAATEEAPLPVITISAVSRSLTEGDAALFQLTRDGDLTNSLSVDVAVTETGDMISGIAPSSATFSADQSTVRLEVPTEHDDADEPDSDIRAAVQSGSAYTVGSRSTATVTIADDDDPVDAPGVPTNLRATADGQAAINLAWVAPRNTGNAPITGYRIEVSSDGVSWGHLLANTGSAAKTYAHGGLPPGTTRHYRVSAINSAGIGAASNVASAATEEAPLPVVRISAVSRSLTEGDAAVFELTRNGKLGNTLLAYVDITETGDMISGRTPSSVRFPARRNTVTLIVATDNDDTDESSSVITAIVRSGNTYTVGSNAAATVTVADNDDPVDVPGVPTNLSATADGRTAINLAWVAPRNTGNAPTTGYRIEVSSDGSSWEHLLGNTGSAATTYAHRGLDPGTTRYYRVSAINSAGIGAASNVASAATEQAPLPIVTISAVSRSLTEGDAAVFQLTRDGDLGNPLFADVDISETGDMISGNTPSSVGFPARQNTVTLIVATDNDDTDESSSVITAIVRSGSTYTVGSSAAATVTIADDDDPVDIPGVPTNLSATANGRTAINLAWVAPRNTGNAPTTGYRIEVSSDGSSWEHLLGNTGSAATTYAHGGLPPGTTRYYRVSAINSAGIGAASNVASAATEQAPLPIVTISAVSRSLTEGDAAVFQLTRDGDLGNPLFADVDITETGDMISGNTPSSVGFPARQNTVTLIVATDDDDADEPDSDITVTVRSGSTYTVGSSAAATVTIADDDDPVDIPGVPTNLSATANGRTAINLAWVAPRNTGNAPTTGYRIEVSSDGGSWGHLLANTGSAATTYAHRGLPPGTTRHYRVYAINSAGTGAASNVASAATEQAPLPVVGISAVSRSLTEGAPAIFQLTRDGDLGNPLLAYVDITETGDMISGRTPSSVRFPARQNTVTLIVATDNDDTDESSSVITAIIRSGSTYTVGSSAAATVTVADDDEPVDIPGVPTNLSATANGQATINLAWVAPRNTGNAPITGYRIEVSSDGVSWGHLLANTGSTATTYAHRGLPPGTTRHYRVYAINSAGTGAASNVASAATEEAPLPVVTVAAVASPVPEGKSAAFQLTRTSGRGQLLTVEIEVIETGTMIHGKVPVTVSFPGDQDRLSLAIPTDNDAVDEPDSEITLTVRAGSGFVVGTRSSATVMVVDDDLARLGAPIDLRAIADGRSAIDLTWSPPNQSGTAAIIGYRIETSGDGMAWRDLANTLSAETSYRDAGLSPETTRSYRVSAITEVGTGKASNVATATTEPPVPVESLSSAWTARFGRTIASQLTDGISARMERLSQPRQKEVGLPGARPGHSRSQVDPREAMAWSSFLFPVGDEGDEASPSQGGWTAWGRGVSTIFQGAEVGHTLDGQVFTRMAGVDYQRGKVLAGVAVSHSAGDGSFQSMEDTGAGASAGKPEGSFIGVHPYVQIELSDELSAWGLTGHGRGRMSISDPSIEASRHDDVKMDISAFGVRASLVAAGAFGLDLATDGFVVRTGAQEVVEASIPMTEASRLRLALEGSRSVSFGSGRVFTASAETGVRRDGGDAETGIGVEVGGGLKYADQDRGLRIEAVAKRLATHEDRDYREWGFGGSISFQPGGTPDRGLSVTMQSSWGGATSGVERLWSQPVARIQASRGERANGVFHARLQYGIGTLDQRLAMAPYADIRLGDGHDADAYRVGWRSRIGDSLNLRLETDLGRLRAEGMALALQGSLTR